MLSCHEANLCKVLCRIMTKQVLNEKKEGSVDERFILLFTQMNSQKMYLNFTLAIADNKIQTLMNIS